MPQQRSRRGGAGGASGGKIPTHPLVEALVPDPGEPPQRTTRLFGYPGPSTDSNATRLYLDQDLSTYVDVPNDAIRHSQTLENDQGTHVWVDPAAPLKFSTTQTHEVQADFLSGSIAQQHLGTAAAAGAVPGAVLPTPTIQVTHFGPCMSDFAPCGFTQIPHCWRTETCPPSHFVPCGTYIPPCPSAGFTCTHLVVCGVGTPLLSVACPPTLHCAQSLHRRVCPSWFGPCGQTQVCVIKPEDPGAAGG
jgi:hypothetical protein